MKIGDLVFTMYGGVMGSNFSLLSPHNDLVKSAIFPIKFGVSPPLRLPIKLNAHKTSH